MGFKNKMLYCLKQPLNQYGGCMGVPQPPPAGSVSALRAPQGQSRLQNTHTSAMNANLYLANRNIAFYIRIH